MLEISQIGVGDFLDLGGFVEAVGEGEEIDGSLGDADGEFFVEELGVADALGGVVFGFGVFGGVFVHVG
jgi:hypothetical protein